MGDFPFDFHKMIRHKKKRSDETSSYIIQMNICIVFPVFHVYFVTKLKAQSALWILNALSNLLKLELPKMNCPLAKAVK